MQNQNQRSGGQGFRQIGTLAPTVSNTPKAKGTTSTKSSTLRTGSELTAPTKGLPARIGSPGGACGSSATLTSTDPLVLAGLTTGALMKALEALLPPLLALSPEWRDGETEWNCPLVYRAAGTAADKAKAASVVRGTMTTLPPSTLARELTKLNALTKRRKEDHVDTELLIAAYVEKLAPYPGEAVVYVLKKWPETEDGKWWPSWSELHEMLEYRVGERRLMLEALG